MRTERGAAPCISILVSDLLLHLGICEGFQKRAPLVSIPCVANRDFHSRQRVFTAAAGQKSKQHSSVLTVRSSGLPAQVQDTSTADHFKCFRLKHSLSPSEHSPVPRTGAVTPQGDQLLPTREDRHHSDCGRSSLLLRPLCTWLSVFEWSKHRQHSDQFINVGRMSPRAVTEQGLLTWLLTSFAILQLLLPSCSLPRATPAALPSMSGYQGAWQDGNLTVKQGLCPHCHGKGSFLRTCCCNHRLRWIPAQKHRALSQITRLLIRDLSALNSCIITCIKMFTPSLVTFQQKSTGTYQE